ncbi:HD-GYP domain-containing protein [Saccharibacillus sp. CPCC 101409]|uniref:HD-GYP domain-containing protein n=1 Tax=Saccharibacillus sp. CPCC 101409 TaxID=3058041 RepID=UPI002670E204|nr:HD-GYP domain-containing protein [Saccharibacillus sp. CPCC 101409]MDO3408839.1 HD-GYP domain-containing protein [Saccharibacillus sp. CPCC 101409]
MKVHVTDLKPGDRLIADTFNRHGVHILAKGTALHDAEIARLVQHSIDYVEVHTNVDDVYSSASSAAFLFPEIKSTFDDAILMFESLFHESITTGRFESGLVEDIMQPLFNVLASQKDAVALLLLLNRDANYTYVHSMQVGMLSYYLSLWMGYPHIEASAICQAGYLHDIGKSTIPGEILNKPGRLTKEEYEVIKMHTVNGYEIIRNSLGDTLAATAALQHHERGDGSGYPHGIKEDEIHPWSRIIAVADVYSAMTSNRVYQNKQELINVLKELYALSFGQLAPEPTHTFIRNMLPYFINKRIRLNNGEHGYIVMNHPTDFFRPLIRVNDRFIDLSAERDLHIEEVFSDSET